MAEMPKTLEELKEWAQQQQLDPKKYAIDKGVKPDVGGYYILGSPWAIYQRTVTERFTEGFVVRCATEAELCECFVELVKGTYREKTSLTQRLRDEMRAKVRASWIDESGKDPTQIKRTT